MKKIFTLAVTALCVCYTAVAFAQNNLAAKYRADMVPLFVKYAAIGSMSDDNAEWMTPGQEKMADVLVEDIKNIFDQIAPESRNQFHLHFSKDKYIYVNIDSNLTARQAPVLGISAHYDTTPDIIGEGIKPQVIKKYDGQPIVLKNGHVMDFKSDPYLQKMVGKTIVTPDGTTNLGADDKAGTTIVMTLIKTLAENPQLPHGPIQIVITPNEDVGRSAERLELEYYNPDYAFDFDAGVNGEVIIANFSADKIIVTAPNSEEKMFRLILSVTGVNAHQSYGFTNGYRNAPSPYSYLVEFADDLTKRFPSCKTNMTNLFSHPKTVKTGDATQTLEDLLLRCDNMAEADAYLKVLHAEIDRVSKEAEVTVNLKVSQLDTQDPKATIAIAKLVHHATKTENLPNHSTGEQGYNEPHHIGTNYADFRLRYFDNEEGARYRDRIQFVADSLSKALELRVPLEVKVIHQYANVENGVKPESLLLIANAMSEAGFRLPKGKTKERLVQISKETGIKLLKGHGPRQDDFKKERAGTTSAMIMAKHGFGGYTVFTGQNNPHAFTEWLSEEDMFKAYEVALNLVKEVSQMNAKTTK